MSRVGLKFVPLTPLFYPSAKCCLQKLRLCCLGHDTDIWTDKEIQGLEEQHYNLINSPILLSRCSGRSSAIKCPQSGTTPPSTRLATPSTIGFTLEPRPIVPPKAKTGTLILAFTYFSVCAILVYISG